MKRALIIILSLLSVLLMAPTEELFGAYNFLLEIEGINGTDETIVGGFVCVDGMDTEAAVVSYGGGNSATKPKRTFVITRPYDGDDTLLDTLATAGAHGDPVKVDLTAFDGAGHELSTFKLRKIVPVRHEFVPPHSPVTDESCGDDPDTGLEVIEMEAVYTVE